MTKKTTMEDSRKHVQIKLGANNSKPNGRQRLPARQFQLGNFEEHSKFQAHECILRSIKGKRRNFVIYIGKFK